MAGIPGGLLQLIREGAGRRGDSDQCEDKR